jgi:integrase
VERLTPGDSWGSRAWSSQRPWARLWSREICPGLSSIWCSGPASVGSGFHDLGHTCASLLLAQGVSPRVVMDVLGHSQLSITMDLYSHVMPSALRDAADAMDRALSGRR